MWLRPVRHAQVRQSQVRSESVVCCARALFISLSLARSLSPPLDLSLNLSLSTSLSPPLSRPLSRPISRPISRPLSLHLSLDLSPPLSTCRPLSDPLSLSTSPYVFTDVHACVGALVRCGVVAAPHTGMVPPSTPPSCGDHAKARWRRACSASRPTTPTGAPKTTAWSCSKCSRGSRCASPQP